VLGTDASRRLVLSGSRDQGRRSRDREGDAGAHR
jgi:hypothetical protein